MFTDDYRKQLAKHFPARIEGVKLPRLTVTRKSEMLQMSLIAFINRLSVDVGFQDVREPIQSQLTLPQNDGHRQSEIRKKMQVSVMFEPPPPKT